jgi:hypothetical protein
MFTVERLITSHRDPAVIITSLTVDAQITISTASSSLQKSISERSSDTIVQPTLGLTT